MDEKDRVKMREKGRGGRAGEELICSLLGILAGFREEGWMRGEGEEGWPDEGGGWRKGNCC